MGYTNFPNGITSFGIPLHGQTTGFPVIGNAWWVNGTKGSDTGYAGKDPNEAFATVQKAVTTQIATSTGLGDVIYIAPGTYAETVVASTLVDCQMIGIGMPGSVVVAPTDGHALLIGAQDTTTSTMLRSALKNITFKTPSESLTYQAAVTIAVMMDSVIEDCRFLGTTTTTMEAGGNMTIGLQISNMGATEWEFHERNRISRCKFTTHAGRLTELGTGILVGGTAVGNPAYRGFSQNVIEYCDLFCYDTGIYMRTGASSCGGTVIRGNTIGSNQGGGGPNIGIKSSAVDGEDLLTMICDNRIAAITDCIRNFSTGNVQANIVSLRGGGPGSETGQ